MNTPASTRRFLTHLSVAAACLALVAPAHAAGQVSGMTTIDAVAVSGGPDTANPGTSCIRIAVPVAAACTGGYIAIPNNNKQLLTAALVNKATGGNVAIYYDDATGTNHCPGIVFTPCALISIFGQ